jgi:copper chaperone CopZ
MKKLVIIISFLCLTSASSLFAEATVTLEGVHLCCKACVRGVEKAVTSVEGATVVADKDAGTAVLSAPDQKILRQGINAMLRGGFYGTPKDSKLKVRDRSGSEDRTVKTLTVTGVHLCCNGCINAVEDALATVDGVKDNTMERKVDSFQITGEFNEKAVFAALNKAGFAGKVGK